MLFLRIRNIKRRSAIETVSIDFDIVLVGHSVDDDMVYCVDLIRRMVFEPNIQDNLIVIGIHSILFEDADSG